MPFLLVSLDVHMLSRKKEKKRNNKTKKQKHQATLYSTFQPADQQIVINALKT
jgi:hypothetical protein